jgi:transposase-like protein
MRAARVALAAELRCPGCGHTGHRVLARRRLLQCHRCHRQSSLTGGAIFAATKLPLRTWLLAMYLLSQAKNGVSAIALARHIGVSYNSAWLLKHKLMQVTHERDRPRRRHPAQYLWTRNRNRPVSGGLGIPTG